MDKNTIAYTAGLFDGEGCIVITRGPKKNLITSIQKEWDEGHICKIPPRKVKNGMSKPQLRWQLTHRQAHRVLAKIMPHMREQKKLERANEIIEYYRSF